MGLFDRFRRRKYRVERHAGERQDIAWWWLYMQSSTPPGDDSATARLEEICRQHGVDPDTQRSVDPATVPGLQDALVEACRQQGIDPPAPAESAALQSSPGPSESGGGGGGE
jgi:hypothetical protein